MNDYEQTHEKREETKGQNEKQKKECMVKPYLRFLDNNVLFKKPISCFFAIDSLLFPVIVLSFLIQTGIFRTGEVKFIVAAILILIVFGFAGIFGACIWWFRRITRDEGSGWYNNFRRFIQTMGEWLGTVVAICVSGTTIILLIFLSREMYYFIPFSVDINIATAFYGPIIGFLIIIATKILLFLLDPVIWLIKQIWKLAVRVVLYCYRFILGFFGTIEKNTPFWVGATWVLAVGVIIATIVLCFTVRGIAPIAGLAAALGFMGYFMFKRKHYDV
jgi:hypothetical protein